MEKHNSDFLKHLSEKTFYWQEETLGPNMSRKGFHTKSATFLAYRIPQADFLRVLTLIGKEPLFVRPKTSLTGYVEGYWVYDVNMFTKEKELVLLFGKDNLPKGYNIKDLFDILCHSKKNRELMQILPKEEPIKSEFEEYCY
jgi:hypothetical protein